MFKYLIYTVIISVSLVSCTINTDLMLKTDKEYQFSELTDSVINSAREYRIAPNDLVQFKLYDNDAYVVLEPSISNSSEGNNIGRNNALFNQRGLSYLVEKDSTIDLPELRQVKLAGLTVRELEDTLEALYSKSYVKPYVQVNITNKRVIVFPGGGGQAQVLTLANNNTTLMEVLAQVGGIATRGNAKHVKLMRNVDNVRHVYEIDLSTIDGLKYTDMLVQANDYIYVEPVPEVGREILRDISPIVSLISSTLLMYTVIRTLKN